MILTYLFLKNQLSESMFLYLGSNLSFRWPIFGRLLKDLFFIRNTTLERDGRETEKEESSICLFSARMIAVVGPKP